MENFNQYLFSCFIRFSQIQPLSSFMTDTGNTFLCHINIYTNDAPELKDHQSALEFLSNLTPNSYLYNQTIQKLRRNKRSASAKDKESHIHTHKKINNSRKEPTASDVAGTYHGLGGGPAIAVAINHHGHSNKNGTQSHNHNSHGNQTQLSAAMLRKINTEKYWKKLKNYTKYKHKLIINSHNQTPMKVSTLILNTSERHDCAQLSVYGLLAIAVYVAFMLCLYNFLFISESAVFTVAIVSAALPVTGIFWSMFALTTTNHTGKYSTIYIQVYIFIHYNIVIWLCVYAKCVDRKSVLGNALESRSHQVEASCSHRISTTEHQCRSSVVWIIRI